MSVKRTTARAAASRAPRPKRGTDWEHLRKMSDRDSQRNAAADRDNPPANASWLDGGQLVEPIRKRAISLRLDQDVIDWFRETGPRYQSRMNAVLRTFVEHQRRNGGKRTRSR